MLPLHLVLLLLHDILRRGHVCVCARLLKPALLVKKVKKKRGAGRAAVLE